MLNSYQDYYYKTVMARGWSGTHLLCLFITYLVIALPFYLSFTTQSRIMVIFRFLVGNQNKTTNSHL